jgi:hypothetical protein
MSTLASVIIGNEILCRATTAAYVHPCFKLNVS